MRLLILLTFLPLSLLSQKKKEQLTIDLEPALDNPYYIAYTEKKDSVYRREMYYAQGGTPAMVGTFKDKRAKEPHGEIIWFYPTGTPFAVEHYTNGKQDGAFVTFNMDGSKLDSSNFRNGRRYGVRMVYAPNGMVTDSLHYDGTGKATHIRWDVEGYLESAGLYEQDSIRTGKWKFFYPSGKLKSTVNYIGGSSFDLVCYDENGAVVDPASAEISPAVPAGDVTRYSEILDQGIQFMNMMTSEAGWKGEVKLDVMFTVNEDGSISNLRASRTYPLALEVKAMNIISQSAPWIPARKCGVPVKSEHTQPIMFMVEKKKEKE